VSLVKPLTLVMTSFANKKWSSKHNTVLDSGPLDPLVWKHDIQRRQRRTKPTRLFSGH